jgi:LPXTG-site transpeptidase (sortase) family protein
MSVLSGVTGLGRFVVATTAGLQVLVAVLAGGAVVGSFLVPGSDAVARTPQYSAIAAGAPIRLVMPELHVSAPVVPIDLDGSALDPPQDYHEVGWWQESAKPGATQGQTVITGHTLHTGGASMNRLGSLAPDDLIDVVSKRGRMRYVVQTSTVYSRAEITRQAAGLFGQDHGRGRLVLITCTDWNGTDYESNVVVVAKPLGAPVRQSKAAKEKAAAQR